MLLENTKEMLPLRIEFTSWDGTTFILSGTGWSFSTVSPWRILGSDGLFIGCYSSGASSVVEQLKGHNWVSVAYQSNLGNIDPVLSLSDQSYIEIFSAGDVDPWVINIEGLPTLVA